MSDGDNCKTKGLAQRDELLLAVRIAITCWVVASVGVLATVTAPKEEDLGHRPRFDVGIGQWKGTIEFGCSPSFDVFLLDTLGGESRSHVLIKVLRYGLSEGVCDERSRSNDRDCWILESSIVLGKIGPQIEL